MRGVEYARMASGVGRFGRYGAEAARLGRLATEGIVYGGSMHMGGLVVPNIMHGRDWNEGFDRNELFFNMGLGAIYPALHALNL